MNLQHFIILIIAQLATAFNDNFTEKELWIEQKLDHFDENETRTWQMRYSESDTFYKPGGPILINVNGEWPLAVKSELCGMFYELAEKFNAYAFQTEHRYYGNSHPVQNLTAENLQYLTMKQALADLAHFVRHQKASVPGLANSKVIMIGCSYAGSMVAYFRKDYPELIDGGWSSCAGLYYRLDYSDAYISVGKSIRKIGGDACYDQVDHFSKAYLKHKKANDENYTLLQQLNLTVEYNNMDEIIATHVQHRNISMFQRICINITAVDSNDIVEFGLVLKHLSSKIPEVGNKDEIEFSEDHSTRQYFYQSCNEFGNFQTTSSQHQPFGDRKPFSTLIAQCKEDFGPKFTIEYISKKVDEINALYGGSRPNVDHIYFTKAEDDPWRWTGIVDECATVIPGIAHCHDLRTRSPNDPPALAAAKQKGFDLIESWINGGGNTRETLTKC
ncbi:putative serine protease K12H4.7 [Drosophila montana]|uniref:putative serine protease K12H4.7 n=1 Tax=Drosophila montana TaxID=40370 RepID=UPI00313EAEE3